MSPSKPTFLPANLQTLLVALTFAFSSLGGFSAFGHDREFQPSMFQKNNLVAWCIVPFDSK